MASGDTLCKLYPLGYEPPATNYATIDTRNGKPVLDFDDTTAEAALWTEQMPRHYGGSGITVYVHWYTTSATSGTGGWTVELERNHDAGDDIDSDSFASAQTITAVTVPGTSGVLDVVNVAISSGANMDSIAAGDQFRIRVKRDVANDTASGDLELAMVEIKET